MLLKSVSGEEYHQRLVLTEQERLARIDAVMGMFAHLPGSVDNFMQEKQKDIDAEDRRLENREQK